MIEIIWSPLSIERLEDIIDYIAYDSPESANSWLDKIFDKIDLLKENPRLGRIVPEINIENIREIIFGYYRIIYQYDETFVKILTVRNFKRILPIEELE